MEEYLERCILSVVEQSHSNLEIILVNDGSTDRSADICNKWELVDSRIKVIHQKNAGLGAARNTGIANTKSEYITFLDSDDWFESNFVKHIIEAMIVDGSEVGQCDIYYVDSTTMTKQAVKLRYNNSVISANTDKSVVNKSRLFAWGKIYRKELLSKFEFIFPNIAYEDSVVPLLIAGSNKISYVSEPMINYLRNRPGSLSNDFGNIGDIKKGLLLLRESLMKFNMYEDFILEYKKIALGQLRFACRKCETIDDDKVVTNKLRELEICIANFFPELRQITRKKYFAYGDSNLTAALDNSLPHAAQVVTDVSIADYIVINEKNVTNVSSIGLPLIIVPTTETEYADNVSLEYNIAEQIMEKL